MLKKSVLFAVVLSALVSSAFASGDKFYCSNVGGTEEWTVYVDLKKGLAGFFDNDNTAVVPMTDMRILESLPSQTVYTFEGADTGGGSKEKLRIDFNLSRLSASVTFDSGNRASQSVESLDGCVADENIDLDLE